MDPLKTAHDLLGCLSKEKAVAHTEFVLSPGYGLLKKDLRAFWEEVRDILNSQDLSTNPLSF